MGKSLLVALALVAGACTSSSDEPDAPAGPRDGGVVAYQLCVSYDDSAADLAAPVSFANDVLPLLQNSCGLSASCHGGTRRPILSRGLAADDALANLLAPSRLLPSMAYVTPGDLAASFLMLKMDGAQCVQDLECTGGSCNGSMPDGADLLPVEQRDLVRRWIAQGATLD